MNYVRDGSAVVDTATEIADVAAAALLRGSSVIVSLRGVRGISSSFFNVLLATVYAKCPQASAGDRFVIETETETQRQVLLRSVQAVQRLPREG